MTAINLKLLIGQRPIKYPLFGVLPREFHHDLNNKKYIRESDGAICETSLGLLKKIWKNSLPRIAKYTDSMIRIENIYIDENRINHPLNLPFSTFIEGPNEIIVNYFQTLVDQNITVSRYIVYLYDGMIYIVPETEFVNILKDYILESSFKIHDSLYELEFSKAEHMFVSTSIKQLISDFVRN